MEMRIRLGPAGSPVNSTYEGIKMVKQLGLQAMEVEFVKGIHMGETLAENCGKLAKELGVSLSVHAPYYINLLSPSKKIREESVKRILLSCKRAEKLGSKYVVFHPGYYGNISKSQAYQTVKDSILQMQEHIEKMGWKTYLAPETSGKISQFGSFEEIINLVKDTGCEICVDFAHIYGRNFGRIDYRKIFNKLEELGIRDLHSHFSNISYGLKGEKRHEVMDSSPPFEPLAKEILERNFNITIISESPVTWKDSLKMKKIFEDLGFKKFDF